MNLKGQKTDVKIKIENLSFSYKTTSINSANILDNLSIDVMDREFLTVVGASGCGKSTLLNIIAGLIPPKSGNIYLNNEPTVNPGLDRTMVFQDDAVFPWYTVYQNVEYGLKILKVDKKTRAEKVKETLELVGLSKCSDLYPRQLSGGMRKRVDVARALITKPEVLLMDEPFAALDVLTKQKLQEQFLNIWNANRMTVIFVTHDLEEALFLADRVVVMASHPGRIACTVEVPFGRPRTKDIKTIPEFQIMRRDLGQILDQSRNEQ